MLLAVFPDSRMVMLMKAPAEAAGRRPVYRIPSLAELQAAGVHVPERLWGFAERSGQPVSGVFVDAGLLDHVLATTGTRQDAHAGEQRAGEGLVLIGRREAADLMDVDDYWHMNRAFHLADWDHRTRFCGSCAAPMERVDGDIAKVCHACGNHSYPQIAPAVIMAIVREGKLLMAHNRRHPGRMFSVLAGFVEAGETLEHAVSREVHEEAGVLIRNIEYFSSQPWHFPNSLMIAFTAEYASGELGGEDDEIEEIGWFGPNELPEDIPSSYSVARRLIEWFVSEYGIADDLQHLLERRT